MLYMAGLTFIDKYGFLCLEFISSTYAPGRLANVVQGGGFGEIADCWSFSNVLPEIREAFSLAIYVLDPIIVWFYRRMDYIHMQRS